MCLSQQKTPYLSTWQQTRNIIVFYNGIKESKDTSYTLPVIQILYHVHIEFYKSTDNGDND